MTEILIIGPGAIGLCVGAALLGGKGSTERFSVKFAARAAFERLDVTAYRGGEVVDHLDCAATVFTDPAQVSAVDWVFVCVKTTQIASISAWMKAAVGPNTKVAIFQNGAEHLDLIAPFVTETTPLVPVIIDLPASRSNNGVAKWRDKALINVPDSPQAHAFVTLLADTFFDAKVADDYQTVVWNKLTINAPTGAVLALTGQPMGVLHREGVAEIVRALLCETVAVGRAEGADLPDSLIEARMQAFMQAGPLEGNSMYEDRLAGRETEWRIRNAVICRLGRKHGIKTPVSDLLVPLLAAQYNSSQ